MAATGLSGEELLDLLAELDTELETPVNILIAGGAALAIRWGVRRTNDVDAVSDDLTPEARGAVARVGERRGMSADWLNDGAKGFAPPPSRRVSSGVHRESSASVQRQRRVHTGYETCCCSGGRHRRHRVPYG